MSAGPAMRCTRCLLPDTMPGLRFDAAGLCNICQQCPSVEALADDRARLRAELRAVIDACRGAKPFDVIVALSGGKDSSYTLMHLVKDLGLRCLAITINNGFLSDGAFANCNAVCSALGVDHVMYTPNRAFTERLYRSSAMDPGLHAPSAIKRASAICSSCINLINTHMLQQAMALRVPLVAGGYLGGQVPRQGAMMVIRPGQQVQRRAAMLKVMVSRMGEDARAYFDLPVDTHQAQREITVINPMLSLDLSEQDILAALTPLGWVYPADTGKTSSNCRLNDLGVYLHARRHGFHPYAMEIAEQLRQGVMTREQAIAKLDAIPSRNDVSWLAERIGLAPDAF